MTDLVAALRMEQSTIAHQLRDMREEVWVRCAATPKAGARAHLPHAAQRGASVRPLDEWFYFDRPEPRLGAFALMRYCPPLVKGVGIFHYQLGNAKARG